MKTAKPKEAGTLDLALDYVAKHKGQRFIFPLAPARFVRKAAHHFVRAADPAFREEELLLLAEARSQAQKYAAKADEVSAMLKKRATLKIRAARVSGNA
jgi:hypothetical protein